MSKKGIYYNIPDKYKYSVAFDNIKIKPLISEEKDKYLSLASKANLKKFLPKDLPDENIGLLAWAGNFCVANKINLNSDCVSTKEALYISDLLPYTYADLEHKKDTIMGVILTAGFSEYGTDKPLTREEVKDYTKPFNITAGGVIWRIVNPDFADEVEKMGQLDSQETISLSWEIAFNSNNLILIDKDKTNLEDGKIISDAAEISKLENNLQAFGGTGFIEGKRIARLIIDEPLPLGAGFVTHPAGQVGQIITASNSKSSMICPECGEDTEMEDDMDEETEHSCAKCGKKSMGNKWKSKANIDAEILSKIVKNLTATEAVEAITSALNAFTKENLKISQNSNSQLKNNAVNQDTIKNKSNKSMITTIKNITDEVLKEATASEIIKAHKIDLDAEVTRISQEFEEKKNKVDNELKASNEKSTKLEGELNSTKEQLSKVQEDLNKLVKAAADKAAEDTFNARMNYFDTEFELDEKSRNAVANRVKNLDEAGYKVEKEDLETLLAAKKKGFVPFKKKDSKEEEKTEKVDNKTEEKKETKASVEDKTDETVVEDAIDKGTKVAAAVAATTTITESNKDKFARIFGKDAWIVNPNAVRK